MRIVLAAALITIAGGAIADDRTNLAKRYESAESIKALVEAGRPFFSDLSRACRKVTHLLTELREGWGQDPVRNEAYSSISSCCLVVGTTNLASLINVLVQTQLAPTKSAAVNYAFSAASAPVHASLEPLISDARASADGQCKKVPVLAAILTDASK
ncbi:hypothetical protein [Bosea massiliensis]|uniref:Secreted protein n=1 Tax=Bosea massiliensis TaxID=151419 RepID=A0ABW0NYA0_9HYPH